MPKPFRGGRPIPKRVVEPEEDAIAPAVPTMPCGNAHARPCGAGTPRCSGCHLNKARERYDQGLCGECERQFNAREHRIMTPA